MPRVGPGATLDGETVAGTVNMLCSDRYTDIGEAATYPSTWLDITDWPSDPMLRNVQPAFVAESGRDQAAPNREGPDWPAPVPVPVPETAGCGSHRRGY